jgi:hypothetical protein
MHEILRLQAMHNLSSFSLLAGRRKYFYHVSFMLTQYRPLGLQLRIVQFGQIRPSD